jgi:hypothetical protein
MTQNEIANVALENPGAIITGGIPLLVTSDKHLLSIDEDALLLGLQRS